MKENSIGKVIVGIIACSAASMLGVACGSPGQVGGSQAGRSGSGAVGGIVINPNGAGGAAVQGGHGGAAGSPGNAGTCGSVTNTANRAPADMLIVLDRSLSMTYSTDADCICSGSSGGMPGGQPCSNTTTCTDRWTAVKTAVTATVTANPSISWGLEFFAATDARGNSASCTIASTPEVPIGGNNAATIQAQIAAASPGSYTPTAAAIDAATAYLKTVKDGNNKAILLATDGMPNCGRGAQSTADDLPGATAAVTAANAAGFPVYVIGIGPQASITNLSQLAVAGGTGNYYPATSPQQLTDALSKIAQIVATCTFNSAQPPPDASLVYVYVDKNLVEQSATNGWSFGATTSTINLNGTYCSDIMSGKATQVQIVFGCPGVPPNQIIP